MWWEYLAERLRGKKTYLSAVGIAVVTFFFYLGWIDRDTYEMLLGLLGASGLISLRVGMKSMK